MGRAKYLEAAGAAADRENNYRNTIAQIEKLAPKISKIDGRWSVGGAKKPLN
jgi:hypothetical protein